MLFLSMSVSTKEGIMADIKFGTDGWRAVTGKEFNAENVALVANAIGKYVYETFGPSKKILIGYDPRNMADVFSMQTAKILSDLGFEVLYSEKVIPTPILAFNAKELNACAIMFTASHNPPEYLGIKFIPDYAGPATSDITDKIVSYIGTSVDKFADGAIISADFRKAYYEHIEDLIDFEKIRQFILKGEEKVIFDGLYSASIEYFNELLKDYIKIPFESIHMNHDVNFGGGMPEPKPIFMTDVIEMIKKSDNSIGMANDGDGDRFGVINEKGEYVSPNEIISILLMHLKENKGYDGPLVKTVGASLLLDKIAEKLSVKVIETPVGFKHVGEAMRKYNPIIAGEESGGLSIKGHIPEKDGIVANLLILEAMAYYNSSLLELQNKLYEIVGERFYNDRTDLKLENLSDVKPVLEKFKSLKSIGSYTIERIDPKDGAKLYLEGGSSWILVRPSGTEPLLRIYFESNSLEKIEDLKTICSRIL